ncbi:MAG: histidine kinase [Anaerolineales bacterium]|jgi:signal transduction histidine kinase|nr:histidine kinase [Anaerolineales bacterium]
MRYFVTYLIYIAVLVRAAGWSQDSGVIPILVWLLLGVFGLLLSSEQATTRRLSWYPRLYLLAQSALVIVMLYTAPTLDILTMLFMPLSFQAVQFYPGRIGFVWIGVFSLALLGLFFVGAEVEAGIAMLLNSTVANTLMGSFAHLMKRTEQKRKENQQLFANLQAAYRQLKDSSTQAEALAAAEERHRLVRELHDSLTQTLFSMNLVVQAAQLSLRGVPGQVEEHLLRLQSLARSAASEVQSLTGQIPLRQPTQAGLEHALRRLAEERLAQDGLQVTIEITGQRELPAVTQAALYRIAQEALNNITRHAGVCKAVIRLLLEPPPARLEIEDAGCGFDPAGFSQQVGFGLSGMASRATEIGWVFEVQSQPGQGARIWVEEQLS